MKNKEDLITKTTTPQIENHHLDALETESIYIIREAIATAKKPAILFSGGKDSVVLFHLACKAFKFGNRKLKLPFQLLHIDTGHNYPEVIKFRDEVVKQNGVSLKVGHVEDSIKKGTVTLRNENDSRNAAQSITLLEAIEENQFDVLMGGARRDEEKARAKERIFSFRDEFGQWDPRNQRPELWDIYNTRIHADENIRVFPISNWTELDIWQYITKEELSLPPIYFSHLREIVRRNNFLAPVTSLTPKGSHEESEIINVRFRTVGDITCTCPVESKARSAKDIVIETAKATQSERSETRMDDKASEAAMENRKKAGYF